jgi:hypothetical protein
MEAWFNDHILQIAGVIVGLILLPGSNFAVTRANDHAVLLWFAYIVRAVIGLLFGISLYELISWLTNLPGTFGGIVSSVGAIIATIGGWIGMVMLVQMFRDLGDGKPDAEARRAALWVPILAPATFSAVWNIVTNPRGLGTGITAAIIALISVIALRIVVKSCLKPSKHPLFWKWTAVAVSLLGGIIMIPLVAFADSQVAEHASGDVSLVFRLVLAAVGLTLLIGAIADAWPKKEKNEQTIVPDKWVRAFAAYGVPVLFLFGALGVGFVSDRAAEQGNILVGSVQR